MASKKKLLLKLEEHLAEDEQVEHSVSGTYTTDLAGEDTYRRGVLAATNLRLVFYAKKFGGYELEVFPFAKISSFEMSKSFGGKEIKFYTSGNKVHLKGILDDNLAEFVDFVKECIDRPSSGQATPEKQLTGQLQELFSLKEQGFLTDDEFAAKKTQILGVS